MNRYLLIFILLLIFFACKQKTAENIAHNTNKKANVKRLTKEEWLLEVEKSHSVIGVVELSKSKVILFREAGIELSINGGRTWKWIAKDLSGIREFTEDDKGTWWAISYWIGIHEASRCDLYQSLNKGKTWTSYAFNTDLFFPYHIDAAPGKPLGILNWRDDKLYVLSGNDPRHNWQFVKQLPDHNNWTDISVENYFISRSNNKLYVKRKSGKTDTLTNFPKAFQIRDIAKVDNVIYVTGSSLKDGASYLATLKNEHELTEYDFFPQSLEMKITQFGHIYLYNYEGAYRFINGKLIHVF
jgi:hypothetical protein